MRRSEYQDIGLACPETDGNKGRLQIRSEQKMLDPDANKIPEQPRFRGISKAPIRKSAPMSKREELERCVAADLGGRSAVALNSASTGMELALRLAANRLERNGESVRHLFSPACLQGRKVFCSDMASIRTASSIFREGGKPVFIDISPMDWGMDPEALEVAFRLYPDVKIVIASHLYGYPCQISRIHEICIEKGAVLIEDAEEALGSRISGHSAGSFGDYGVLGFLGLGAALIVPDSFSLEKARVWANNGRMPGPFDLYEEAGVDGMMNEPSALSAKQLLEDMGEMIRKRKNTSLKYSSGMDEDILEGNPIGEQTEPNYSECCITCESSIEFRELRTGRDYLYRSMHGTASPMEILDALEAFGVPGKPIRKPLHLQPLFQSCDQVSLDGSLLMDPDFYKRDFWIRSDESSRIFKTGLCLPMDADMTEEDISRVVEIVHACFDGAEMSRN